MILAIIDIGLGIFYLILFLLVIIIKNDKLECLKEIKYNRQEFKKAAKGHILAFFALGLLWIVNGLVLLSYV